MMKPFVSIIVPVYNGEKCIERCFDSILEQSYKNYEVIIIDDGSTDNSSSICDHYSQIDKRFVVRHIKNGGVSNARNMGIEMSEGKYIAFLDSDDYYAPTFLEDMVKKAEEDDATVVISSFYRVRNGELFPENEVTNFFEKGKMNVFKEYDYSTTFVLRHVWGALFDKNSIGNVRFQSEYFVGEDSLFVAEIIKKNPNISIINKCLYYYVYSDTSASHGHIDDKKATVIPAWQEIISTYENCNYSTKDFVDGCYISLFIEIVLAMRGLKDENRLHNKDLIYKEFSSALHKIYIKLIMNRISWKVKVKSTILIISPKIYFWLGF